MSMINLATQAIIDAVIPNIDLGHSDDQYTFVKLAFTSKILHNFCLAKLQLTSISEYTNVILRKQLLANITLGLYKHLHILLYKNSFRRADYMNMFMYDRCNGHLCYNKTSIIAYMLGGWKTLLCESCYNSSQHHYVSVYKLKKSFRIFSQCGNNNIKIYMSN